MRNFYYGGLLGTTFTLTHLTFVEYAVQIDHGSLSVSCNAYPSSCEVKAGALEIATH